MRDMVGQRAFVGNEGRAEAPIAFAMLPPEGCANPLELVAQTLRGRRLHQRLGAADIVRGRDNVTARMFGSKATENGPGMAVHFEPLQEDHPLGPGILIAVSEIASALAFDRTMRRALPGDALPVLRATTQALRACGFRPVEAERVVPGVALRPPLAFDPSLVLAAACDHLGIPPALLGEAAIPDLMDIFAGGGPAGLADRLVFLVEQARKDLARAVARLRPEGPGRFLAVAPAKADAEVLAAAARLACVGLACTAQEEPPRPKADPYADPAGTLARWEEAWRDAAGRAAGAGVSHVLLGQVAGSDRAAALWRLAAARAFSDRGMSLAVCLVGPDKRLPPIAVVTNSIRVVAEALLAGSGDIPDLPALAVGAFPAGDAPDVLLGFTAVSGPWKGGAGECTIVVTRTEVADGRTRARLVAASGVEAPCGPGWASLPEIGRALLDLRTAGDALEGDGGAAFADAIEAALQAELAEGRRPLVVVDTVISRIVHEFGPKLDVPGVRAVLTGQTRAVDFLEVVPLELRPEGEQNAEPIHAERGEFVAGLLRANGALISAGGGTPAEFGGISRAFPPEQAFVPLLGADRDGIYTDEPGPLAQMGAHHRSIDLILRPVGDDPDASATLVDALRNVSHWGRTPLPMPMQATARLGDQVLAHALLADVGEPDEGADGSVPALPEGLAALLDLMTDGTGAEAAPGTDWKSVVARTRSALPPGMTPEWVAERAQVAPRTIRLLHDRRNHALAVCPDLALNSTRPDSQSFSVLLHRALWDCAAADALRAAAGAAKVDFQPFTLAHRNAKALALSLPGVERSKHAAEGFEALLEAGRDAEALNLLAWMLTEKDDPNVARAAASLACKSRFRRMAEFLDLWLRQRHRQTIKTWGPLPAERQLRARPEPQYPAASPVRPMQPAAPPAVTTENEIPMPARAAPSPIGAAEDAQRAWDVARTDLARFAAEPLLPSRAALARLDVAVNAVRAAAEAFLQLEPETVDAGDFVRRLEAVAETARRVQVEVGAIGVEREARVLRSAFERLEELCEAAEAAGSEAASADRRLREAAVKLAADHRSSELRDELNEALAALDRAKERARRAHDDTVVAVRAAVAEAEQALAPFSRSTLSSNPPSVLASALPPAAPSGGLGSSESDATDHGARPLAHEAAASADPAPGPDEVAASLTDEQDKVEPSEHAQVSLPGGSDRVEMGTADEAEVPVSASEFLDLLGAEPRDKGAQSTEAENGVGEDDGVLQIAARIERAFEMGDYALGHQLTAAAEAAFGASPVAYTAGELALAATARAAWIDGGMRQASGDAMAGLLEAVNALGEGNGRERALAAAASSVIPALMRSDRVAIDVLQAAAGRLGGEIGGALHRIARAADEVASQNLQLTPALLRAASGVEAQREEGERRRKVVLDAVEAWGSSAYNFKIGIKVQERLLSPHDGTIGRLKGEIGGERGPEEAKAFATAYETREGAEKLIADTAKALPEGQTRAVEGAALDRMCQRIMAIAAAARAWAEALDASSPARGKRLRDIAARVRTAAMRGCDEAIRAADAEGSLAAALLADVLCTLRRALQGEEAYQPVWTAAAVLHGRLAWMPGLDHGTGWVPQPYDPEAILAAASGSGGSPLPAPGEERDALFLEVSRLRRDRGAFAGARLLLDCASAFGIGGAAIAEARDAHDADLPTRRASLLDQVGLVRGLVEHLQRMGVRTANDGDAQTWLLQLDALPLNGLPLLPPVEELGEERRAEAATTDFSLAEQVIADIEAKVDAAMAGPREALRKRIMDEAPQAHRDELVSLLVDNELVAVAERLDMLREGVPVEPDRATVNRRFEEFFPAVPDLLKGLGDPDLNMLREHAAEGRDFERNGHVLPFSRIPQARRDAARDILADWSKLRLHAKQAKAKSNLQSNVIETAAQLLGALGFRAKIGAAEPGATNAGRSIFAARLELAFPRDTESFLLPHFGSWTQGQYRLVVASGLPDEGTLTTIANQDLATIVLVPEAIDAERRRSIARASLATPGGRRALVIDEAVLLYALTEPELRPLTLIELAQPFSRTQPFGDYGRYSRVPEEMFVGRRDEYEQVIGQRGACVVYGGRRLGKTALLRHVEGEIEKAKGSLICAYVPLDTVGSGGVARSTSLWERVSSTLKQVFPKGAVLEASPFASGVRAWLHGDRARRILLLLDEADKFVEEETSRSHPFAELNALIELMDTTDRAFKFVLAGLHNVARFARFASQQKGMPNPPIGSLDGSAQRIGPLLGKDARDAEALVVRTMAAMGWRFEKREDVWAVLSHTNYYPVLAQTFCQHLLDTLADDAAIRERLDWRIPTETVQRVLASPEVRKSIREKFEFTINELDPRYELIALVAALEELRGREGGEVSDGLTREHIQRDALYYWPKARALLQDANVMEEILNEMEGLGVLRRARADRWAIRSPAVLALLGTRLQVEERLLAFQDREAARPFDPQALRRDLAIVSTRTGERATHFSPFTVGQEERLLAVGTSVVAVFGPPLAEPEYAIQAITEAVAPAGWTVRTVGATKLDGFRAALRAPGRREVLVLTSASPWDREWAEEAAKNKAVREGTARVVLLGGFSHALRWAAVDRARPPGLRTETLGPWAPTALDVLSKRENLPYGEVVEQLGSRLGGWNKAIRRALARRLGSRTVDHLRKDVVAALKEISAQADFGLDKGTIEVLSAAHAVSGDKIHDYYLSEIMVERGGSEKDGVALGRALVLAGLAAPDPATLGRVDDGAVEQSLNPLLLGLLERQATVAAG